MTFVNAFSVAGFLLVLLGIVLVLLGLGRSLRGVFDRYRYRRRARHPDEPIIYKGPRTNRVYVPGTIGRMLALSVLGVLVAVAGLALAWAGLSLAHPYTRVDESATLARLAFGPGEEIRVETAGGESVRGDLGGAIYVAHAETITFGGPFASLGLGQYARLSSIGAYSGPAQVLERRGRLLPVGRQHPLQRMARWVERKKPDWVQAGERVSQPLRDRSRDAEVTASRDGLEWSR